MFPHVKVQILQYNQLPSQRRQQSKYSMDRLRQTTDKQTNVQFGYVLRHVCGKWVGINRGPVGMDLFSSSSVWINSELQWYLKEKVSDITYAIGRFLKFSFSCRAGTLGERSVVSTKWGNSFQVTGIENKIVSVSIMFLTESVVHKVSLHMN